MRQRIRSAFTLVELLVVIAIIGILAAILLVGVIPALRKGPELQATSDIRQMSSALNDFKSHYKISFYPPSYLTLSTQPNLMDPTSLAYINAIWPRLDWNGKTPDWTGTGNTTGVWKLEGDQVLVFLLGGVPDPTTPGVRGFSTNPKDPTAISAGGAVDSFFQFETSRLYQRVAGNPFYSYQDAFGTNQPYVFFSAGKNRDGYFIGARVPNTIGDCPSTMPGGPYIQAGSNPVRFFESTGFQIISAGRDGQFGPGGAWSPANASQIKASGQDDMANFHGFKLGVAQ